jgi:hypothetical protein
MAQNAAVGSAVLRDMQCRWLRGEPIFRSEMPPANGGAGAKRHSPLLRLPSGSLSTFFSFG